MSVNLYVFILSMPADKPQQTECSILSGSVLLLVQQFLDI